MTNNSPQDFAAQAAEAIRNLNHATQTAKGELTYPVEAYNVVALLALLTRRLPQAFEQLSEFLGMLAKTGKVTADYGMPDDHLGEARSALGSAAIVTETLTAFLERAHIELAPLGYDTDA
ncbi:hypothetical protein [Streptomyces violascens]|uniref:hypothetical protein n=1 Tax=Streptomyces violascens TaxID=67381 RepID=UPI0036954DAA